jgi:hypothetical protein
MIRRYGLAPMKVLSWKSLTQARNLAKEAVNKFLTMYDAPTFPYTNLTNTTRTLGLTEITNTYADVPPDYPLT